MGILYALDHERSGPQVVTHLDANTYSNKNTLSYIYPVAYLYTPTNVHAVSHVYSYVYSNAHGDGDTYSNDDSCVYSHVHGNAHGGGEVVRCPSLLTGRVLPCRFPCKFGGPGEKCIIMAKAKQIQDDILLRWEYRCPKCGEWSPRDRYSLAICRGCGSEFVITNAPRRKVEEDA